MGGQAVHYLVFSQAPSARLDAAALVVHARRHFAAELEVLGEDPPGASARAAFDGDRHALRVRWSHARRGLSAELEVRSRPAAQDDLERARDAEVRGKAAGMAALATRCRFVWEVVPAGQADERAILGLCGLLASVALGPVLPPDGATLFGVRGAMERSDRSGSLER